MVRCGSRCGHELVTTGRLTSCRVGRPSCRALEELDRERDSLQKALDAMKAKLRAQTDAAPDKSRFDLSKADWAELAKAGSVIYRTPCVVANGWTLPEALSMRRPRAPSHSE